MQVSKENVQLVLVQFGRFLLRQIRAKSLASAGGVTRSGFPACTSLPNADGLNNQLFLFGQSEGSWTSEVFEFVNFVDSVLKDFRFDVVLFSGSFYWFLYCLRKSLIFVWFES